MNNLIDLSNRNFDGEEYKTLRSEMEVRLTNIYNNGFTLVSVLLVFFSITLVFVAKILEIAMDENSIFGKAIAVDLAVILAISAFCAFPAFLTYAYSEKHYDNLRQICSIACYQKVFYEYPLLLNKQKPAIAWETFHADPNVSKAKWVGAEYVILSVMSLFLTSILGFALSLCCCIMSKQFFYEANLAGSIVFICIFLALLSALIIVLCILIKKTRQNTQTDRIIGEINEQYMDDYLKKAKAINLFNDEQIKKLIEELKTIDELK